MNELSRSLYTAAQIRRIEQQAIEQLGIPGFTLMQRAGQAVFEQVAALASQQDKVVVLCGPGNNGGDGYICAGLLHQAGYRVEVISLCDPDALRGDARRAYQWWAASGEAELIRFDGEIDREAAIIVDAILGTGLQRPLRGAYQLAVQLVNEHDATVVAVDVPTGLSSETGNPMGGAIVANETVTFIGLKLGLFTGRAPDFCGTVILDDLDCPRAAYEVVSPAAVRLLEEDLKLWLHPRPLVSHKGDFGHVLVLGGDLGMSGAARMAGEAALRTGAGLVSIGTHPQHAAVINIGRPELMARGIDSPATQRKLTERASVIAIGPGMQQSAWSHNVWSKAKVSELAMVVDAGALTWLANEPDRNDHRVITPHPGEAARLLQTTTAEIQADRLQAAKELRMKYGGVAVLKGAGTIIAGPGGCYLCDAGNPGMASGGMGDVLTGVIGALIAQGFDIELAACLGVVTHAVAGDCAAAAGQRGLLATDLMPHIHSLVNPA